MIKIRPEQFEVFQSAAESDFAKRVVAYLYENHHDAVVQLPTGEFAVEQVPNNLLHEMVQKGIARARRYGITWESSLTAFIVLMFTVAPNFDECPPLTRVLTDETIEPDLRVKRLCEQAVAEDWEAARRASDASAWHLKRVEAE